MINERRHIDDNGFVSQYWYDAAGERTVKTSGEGEQVYVNSLFSGGTTQTKKFTLYVSPYLVASQGGKYTKHIYVGSQRIVSKLGDLQSYGADPRRIPYAGSESDNVTVDYAGKYTLQQQSIKHNYASFDVSYNGKDNNDYVNGSGFCCTDQGKTRSLAPGQNDNPELYQFYYHPDHLGSSSFITNLDGDVAQHIEYVPFGEVFIEERNNVWNTPYLFNAKELDEETGLYYYGARYYDPRISLWLSVDPKEELDMNVSSYCYTYNNPIKYEDPDGKRGRPVRPRPSVRNTRNLIYPNHIRPNSFEIISRTTYRNKAMNNGARPIVTLPENNFPYVEFFRTENGNTVQLSRKNQLGKIVTTTLDFIDVSILQTKKVFFTDNGRKDESSTQILFSNPKDQKAFSVLQLQYEESFNDKIGNYFNEVFSDKSLSPTQKLTLYMEKTNEIRKEIGISPYEQVLNKTRTNSVNKEVHHNETRRIIPEIRQGE